MGLAWGEFIEELCEKQKWKAYLDKTEYWLFQGGNTGSNPVGDGDAQKTSSAQKGGSCEDE